MGVLELLDGRRDDHGLSTAVVQGVLRAFLVWILQFSDFSLVFAPMPQIPALEPTRQNYGQLGTKLEGILLKRRA